MVNYNRVSDVDFCNACHVLLIPSFFFFLLFFLSFFLSFLFFFFSSFFGKRERERERERRERERERERREQNEVRIMLSEVFISFSFIEREAEHAMDGFHSPSCARKRNTGGGVPMRSELSLFHDAGRGSSSFRTHQ